MVNKIETTIVKLWGDQVGALTWLDNRGFGVFEFDSRFLKKRLDISPIHMGVDKIRQGEAIFSFPSLNRETFLGLPGLLSDALPDKFGNSIINSWLIRNGRSPADFSPVERLCYTGKRGMGALEFFPPVGREFDKSVSVEIAELVRLAQSVMAQRTKLDTDIGNSEKENSEAIMDILRVGTSAGGARPKAVIAINNEGHVLSGQTEAPEGYDYWLLKFDGVSDIELGKPKGYGRIEYAYYLMAKSAGIEMTDCRLLEENGRAHFLTKRFDRINGGKLHLQSLCGLAHYDFNSPGMYSYEQCFSVMRQLRLPKNEAVQQYKRMIFNVVSRNQDDHTKNIAFLMDSNGKWRLSSAFDVTYSHNPGGKWTNRHQMTINGKRDGFTLEDLTIVGKSIGIHDPDAIINEIVNVVNRWSEFAVQAGVPADTISRIAQFHRTDIGVDLQQG